MEYWSAFHKLNENPFGETPNTRFFYYSDQHRAVLAKLAWMIAEGKGFGLLTGDVGTGKTLLCRMLLRSLSERANTALIIHPILSGTELLSAIIDDFKISSNGVPAKTPKAKLDRLNNFLIEEAAKKKKSILIIDDAQRLSDDSLEVIRLLSNLETEQQKLLHILFVGQPELKAKLEKPELRQLGQRISVHPELLPLDEKNTASYISHRIDRAGATNFLRFHPKAVKLIFTESRGIPRLINKLCEGAIHVAEVNKAHLIEVQHVRQVIEPKANSSRGLFGFLKGLKGSPNP